MRSTPRLCNPFVLNNDFGIRWVHLLHTEFQFNSFVSCAPAKFVGAVAYSAYPVNASEPVLPVWGRGILLKSSHQNKLTSPQSFSSTFPPMFSLISSDCSMEAEPELSVQWAAFLVLKNKHGCSSDYGQQGNGGEQQDWNRGPIGVHTRNGF